MITLSKEATLLNKVFLPNKRLGLKKNLIEDFKVPNEITRTIEKYNIESYSTQSKIGQKALIQSKVFEQATNSMGDTIEDMDIERQEKDNKIELLENKIGLPDCKVFDEMNRLGLKNMSSKRKGDRIMDRLNISLNNHK